MKRKCPHECGHFHIACVFISRILYRKGLHTLTTIAIYLSQQFPVGSSGTPFSPHQCVHAPHMFTYIDCSCLGTALHCGKDFAVSPHSLACAYTMSLSIAGYRAPFRNTTSLLAPLALQQMGVTHYQTPCTPHLLRRKTRRAMFGLSSPTASLPFG